MRDAVIIGMGSMIGAGVFSAFSPAAQAAGSGLLLGLGVAAVVAYCNATSSARLAALYPESGGTYIYGRRRLGEFWGYQAGWAFVVGKVASAAAMALTFASYVAPGRERSVAVAAVVALTAVNYRGIRKSVRLTAVVVALTLVALTVVVVACLAGGHADIHQLSVSPDNGVRRTLQSAGLLFFAFAGYARIATLGEEVRDPARTIPRAIAIALGITLAVYVVVAVAALAAVGPAGLAGSTAPLRTAVEAGRLHALSPVVQWGAAVAALGSLLALVLGISRTTLAMARDRHLPAALAAVHPRYHSPHRAELAVGAVVVVLVSAIDLRDAIGFSSFGVLIYYAIANAAAMTLSKEERRPPRWVPLLGLVGCVVLGASLPPSAIVSGAAVLGVGAAIWVVRRRVL
ncbi:MAG: putative amino-acid or metabolite transport protein [Frankiales bacterium]|nr:putative amino-acid or metabolite transport protein [Frankiales bacterium]